MLFFFTAFFAFGIGLVLVGANQAALARDLGLDLTGSGLLAAVLAAGLGVGIVAAGPLFDRYPRRPLFVGALLVAGVSLATADASMGLPRAVAHLAAFGIGMGLYDTLISGCVAERFGAASSRPMILVHAGAILGAMLGHPAIGWLALRSHWSASFEWLGWCHVALACVALFLRFPDPPRPPREERAARDFVRSVAPLAFIAFAYVGVEASLTVFAVPYATGGLALGEERGRLAISAFWFGLFAGRMAVAAMRAPLGARALLLQGAIGAGLLSIGVALRFAQVEILFAAIGLALGGVFPMAIALSTQRVPRARGLAAGVAGGAGAAGGFAIPWLTGGIGDQWGVVAAVACLGFWSLAIAVGALAAARPRLSSPGARV